MQLPRLAIVDLETTGADPNRDRITEMAVLVTEGDQLIEQWSSLVNPGVPIPYRIQEFTGITNEMVVDAPDFETVAEEVRARLAGAVFVAHNARFDYGFLRAAFERTGKGWDAPVMCTVKFSRALDPEYPKHGLDAIITRGGYAIDSRHRALDDAVIVWRFLRDALVRADDLRLQRAWDKSFSTASVPRLPHGDLEALPDSPGAYLFRGPTGQILQIGKARDLRSQVLGLFTGGKADAKSKRLAAAVHDVETWPTAGELGAQLQELRLHRQYKDAATTPALGWRWQKDALKGPVLALEDLTSTDPADWRDVFGCFRGEREAETALKELARQHRLCASRLGLERGGGPCQAVYLNRCHGVCVGKEEAAVHDERMVMALSALRVRAWPYRGPVLIREVHESSERAETHLFDQWCLIGSATSENDVAELREGGASHRRFDADIYRLLLRWLDSPARAVQVVEIPVR